MPLPHPDYCKIQVNFGGFQQRQWLAMGAERERGRCTDPDNVSLALKHRYREQSSFNSFVKRIEQKRATIGPGGRRVEFPESSRTVWRFCNGLPTDQKTWGPLCDELGVPFFLLEVGHTLMESELDNAEFKRRWSFCHPAAYTGPVWIQVAAKFENRAERHDYWVRWGSWLYTDVLQFDHFERFERVSLVHMKGIDDSIPIIFDVSHPCHVRIGRGDPPDKFFIDINHGWQFAPLTGPLASPQVAGDSSDNP